MLKPGVRVSNTKTRRGELDREQRNVLREPGVGWV
ncbi:helicase [Streptomyces sp. DH37]|nr:helicase [Streptomyces sp. DH37]MDG9703300.1 helicase [Streptomyces sp. DH37]